MLFHLRPQLRALRASLPAETLATRRACDWSRVRIALRAAARAQNRVRVYAAAGFVPNSYRYPCKIQYVELRITDGRVSSIGAGWCGAQRSGARGALVVVQ